MKIKVNGYEMEIKAKRDFKKSYNEQDTNEVLNRLALALMLAKEENETALKWVSDYEQAITNALTDAGYYKDL